LAGRLFRPRAIRASRQFALILKPVFAPISSALPLWQTAWVKSALFFSTIAQPPAATAKDFELAMSSRSRHAFFDDDSSAFSFAK
jgi:hypothetical protein